MHSHLRMSSVRDPSVRHVLAPRLQGGLHRGLLASPAGGMTLVMIVLVLINVAAARPPRESPIISMPTLPTSKVRFELDPLAYRSSSQGPLMPAELEPATKADYEEIDSVIERATRTHGWAPIIPQFNKGMTWQRWEGTIIERLWKSALLNMLVPICLLLLAKWIDPSISWWNLPEDHKLGGPFNAIANGWKYILSLATFVTTFFVGHSHDFWRRSYALTRSVQGRLNDLGLLCASHARRDPNGSGLSETAKQLLEDNARNLRLLHCLFYAGELHVHIAHVRVRACMHMHMCLTMCMHMCLTMQMSATARSCSRARSRARCRFGCCSRLTASRATLPASTGCETAAW